jgi:hypothetical protein
MSTAKLMTNILPDYYNFIEKEAKRSQRSKREVVEEAVSLLMKQQAREGLMAQYAEMADDKEYQKEMSEMAEIGMETYLNDLENAYQ